jgi:predicted nucleic acid-binding Zn ribbon protein
MAAGRTLGRAGTPTWSDGVLYVEAESMDWQREIRRARPVIAQRLRHVLGPGVVKTIKVGVAHRAGAGKPRQT